MNFLQEVKNTTRPWHDAMEAVALSDKIAAGTLSLSEYRAIILGHYVFHNEAETLLLANHALQDLEPLAFAERRKRNLLAKDVEMLHLASLCFDFYLDICVGSLARALGCMYVMEGATLGGTVIERSLRQVSEIVDSGAMHYYGCYGKQTGIRWKQFKETVAQQVVSEEDKQAFIETATATFREYTACMEKAMHRLQIKVGTNED